MPEYDQVPRDNTMDAIMDAFHDHFPKGENDTKQRAAWVMFSQFLGGLRSGQISCEFGECNFGEEEEQ